jgi:hypothetical protein|uniref:CAB/ELIP/HLIP-like protein n=1 Tax=Vaucheria litorea TaxID=109269 RepID=B7T1T2_VAULI|nr:CAB/ELIP/HLIP-like protein [Vaucheria litorea]ACF70898.1 CAB/ELIP/HLIP-like protein [Vaucheria litorea]
MNKLSNPKNHKLNTYEPLQTLNWGFTLFSEIINGRIAMIGLTSLFLIELITKQKIIFLIKESIFFFNQ